jgi:methyl-accepting chemotaxis protein
LAEVNKIMTYNEEWGPAGLGQTGEIYTVGPDLLMRSNSRFLIEDPTAYLAQLRANGVPERTVGMIEKLDTSILFQKINSVAASEATQGHEAIGLATGYRQQLVVTAYQPITLETLQWGLIATVDQAEAFASIYAFQNLLLVATVLLTVVYAFAAILIAGSFLRPIQQVIDGIRLARGGRTDIVLPVTNQDELGELAVGFQELLQGMDKQSKLLEQKQQEVERWRLTLLPTLLAQRLQHGELQPVEQATAVSLLMAALTGWHDLAGKKAHRKLPNFCKN